MHLLRLCETREYEPRLLEHWLCTMQKNKQPLEITFAEKDGCIQIITSKDLSPHLIGSRSIPHKKSPLKPNFFVHQKKGPLLPIKRAAQFEDRTNKTRIFPANTLIQLMAVRPGSFIRFRFQPIPERKRRRALKKAKRPHFNPSRRFDQWESKAWFRLSFRRLLGPLLRKAITRLSLRPTETQEQTQSIHEREDPRTATLDKLARPLFQVQIELSHPFQNFASGFSLPYLGQLSICKKPKKLVLSAEELASIASFPSPKETAAHLHTESTAYFPAPKNPLQISEKDRRRHLYLLGKTGMGKSTTILHLLSQDIQENRSIVLIDPHGDLVEDTLQQIPSTHHKKITLLDPSNQDHPLALNPVELLPNESPTLKASALIEMFEALAKGSWGPRLEYILRNTLLTLILAPNTTLLDLPRLLTNKSFAQGLLTKITDQELLRFWNDEFLPQEPRTRQEHIAPILNKVGPLLTSPLLRNIFGQPKSKFNFTQAFQQNRITLISLSKGKLGQDASAMLGMIFISMIQSALLQRASIPQDQRTTIATYIDEFQNFSTPTLLSMLAESRKYGLALTIANQYLTQLRPEIQDAVLGNAGSLLSFRLSHQDAEKIAPALSLTEEDLTNLAPFQVYAKLLKDSQTQPLFRWETPKPLPIQNPNIDKIRSLSLQHFCRRRSLVEEKIINRYNARKLNRAK
jgi:hypothetical protein